MKFPSHIVLDLSKASLKNTGGYWIFTYIPWFSATNFSNVGFKTYKRFNCIEPHLFKKFNFARGTCEYNLTRNCFPTLLRGENLLKIYKLLKPRHKVLNRLSVSNHFNKTVFNRLKKRLGFKSLSYYELRPFKRVISKKAINSFKTLATWRLFDINFLKKEPIYTKLKYSRTPQYDIVSGGAAALFAGFLGFLICEKFGLELLDSGDFYFLFMYLVFFFFFLKLLLKHFSVKSPLWNVLSYKWVYNFYKSFLLLFLYHFL